MGDLRRGGGGGGRGQPVYELCEGAEPEHRTHLRALEGDAVDDDALDGVGRQALEVDQPGHRRARGLSDVRVPAIQTGPQT